MFKQKVVVWLILFVILNISILFMNENKYSVVSESMNPTLTKGDVVFCSQKDNISAIKSGDVVVFRKKDGAFYRTYVKRVKYVNHMSRNVTYYVLGDNSSNSYDSRSFGWISHSQIIGKVKLILWSWDEKNNKLRTDRILKKVD